MLNICKTESMCYVYSFPALVSRIEMCFQLISTTLVSLLPLNTFPRVCLADKDGTSDVPLLTPGTCSNAKEYKVLKYQWSVVS